MTYPILKKFALWLIQLVLFGGLLLICSEAKADTLINYNINKNTHWTAKGSPYLIYVDGGSEFKVTRNAMLKIDPGVTVKFTLGTGMHVEGKLIAHGNPDTPITFTSIYDGGPIGTPMAGDWYGIVVRGADSVLKHVCIKYAGRAGFIGYSNAFSLYISGRDIHFTNSIVEKGAGDGVWLDYYYHGLTHNNIIQNNEGNGMRMTHSEADLFRNTIQRNRENGIVIDSRVNFHGNTVRWNEGNGLLIDTLYAPEIHDNDIYGNLDSGIQVEKGYPRIHHNSIHENENGVSVKLNWPLVIAFNDFFANKLHGLYVEAFSSQYSGVNAENNWWGGVGGPGFLEGNDKASLYIDYEPWMMKRNVEQ